MQIKLCLLLFVLLVLSVAQAQPNPRLQIISGSGQYCDEGDLCRVDVNGSSFKFRLAGINAPALSQKYGPQAQAFTESYIKNKNIRLQCKGTKASQDPKACLVFVNGEEVNRRVVEAGWAYDFSKDSHGKYKSLELEAKLRKLGMWKP